MYFCCTCRFEKSHCNSRLETDLAMHMQTINISILIVFSQMLWLTNKRKWVIWRDHVTQFQFPPTEVSNSPTCHSKSNDVKGVSGSDQNPIKIRPKSDRNPMKKCDARSSSLYPGPRDFLALAGASNGEGRLREQENLWDQGLVSSLVRKVYLWRIMERLGNSFSSWNKRRRRLYVASKRQLGAVLRNKWRFRSIVKNSQASDKSPHASSFPACFKIGS